MQPMPLSPFVDGGRLREGSRRPAHRGGVELVVGQTTLRQGVQCTYQSFRDLLLTI
jgi:hypothetical protein